LAPLFLTCCDKVDADVQLNKKISRMIRTEDRRDIAPAIAGREHRKQTLHSKPLDAIHGHPECLNKERLGCIGTCFSL
jgi:hypothetical protein